MKKENRVVVYVGRGCPAEQVVTPLINQKGKEITYCWAKSNLYKQPHGFTLIELLVVVLIIGILAAVAVPQYQMAVDKTRVSELIPLVQNIKMQQELFYLANGYYAADCEELSADLPAGFQPYEPNSPSYILQQGNYTKHIKCNNGARALANIYSNDGSFLVNIEAYFDSQEGFHRGQIQCAASTRTERGRKVCQTLGREPDGIYSSWL